MLTAKGDIDQPEVAREVIAVVTRSMVTTPKGQTRPSQMG
jgi:hypothetical protein